MTTIAGVSPTTSTHASRGPGRILAVFRLHFANPSTTIGVPWMIMAIILAVNVAIWWIIFTSVVTAEDRADASEGMEFSGASFFIFVYMMVVAIQAIAITFPFALGYGVTRRDYYLGSSLAFVALSAGYAIALTILAELEKATGGWGFGGHMFTARYYGAGEWYQYLFVFFTLFLFFFFAGAAIATIYARWRMYGMIALFGALALLIVGGLALIAYTQSWGAVGEWFVAMGFIGVIAWTLVPTAISAVTGYLVLRKATPKN